MTLPVGLLETNIESLFSQNTRIPSCNRVKFMSCPGYVWGGFQYQGFIYKPIYVIICIFMPWIAPLNGTTDNESGDGISGPWTPNYTYPNNFIKYYFLAMFQHPNCIYWEVPLH